MDLSLAGDLMQKALGTPTAIVVAFGMGIGFCYAVLKLINSKASKDRVEEIDQSREADTAMLVSKLDGGLLRLDVSQSEHHQVMYRKIDAISEKTEKLGMSLARVEGACVLHQKETA